MGHLGHQGQVGLKGLFYAVWLWSFLYTRLSHHHENISSSNANDHPMQLFSLIWSILVSVDFSLVCHFFCHGVAFFSYIYLIFSPIRDPTSCLICLGLSRVWLWWWLAVGLPRWLVATMPGWPLCQGGWWPLCQLCWGLLLVSQLKCWSIELFLLILVPSPIIKVQTRYSFYIYWKLLGWNLQSLKYFQ